MTERWKYAYSAPDQQEYLFDSMVDPLETRNRAGLPTTREILKTLREQTITFFVEGGETHAAEGNQWKVYPRKDLPSDPDSGFLTQDRPGYILDLPGYTD